MTKKYLILIAISGFIIALDQAIKIYVHTHFYLGESVTVIPNYFDLTYVRNPGAAFGIFRDASENFRELFFLSIPPIAVIFILMLLKPVPNKDYLQISALSSVVGGALGNYIDRVRFRYVIDFLDFHLHRRFTWPAFNIADIAIVTGISLIFLITFLEWKNEKSVKTN